MTQEREEGGVQGQPEVDGHEARRMRWASRRGMLELDLVLGPFAERGYGNLDAEDRARYRALMACEDQELFGWFLGRQVPDDPELAAIVRKILAFHRPEEVADPGSATEP